MVKSVCDKICSVQAQYCKYQIIIIINICFSTIWFYENPEAEPFGFHIYIHVLSSICFQEDEKITKEKYETKLKVNSVTKNTKKLQSFLLVFKVRHKLFRIS